MSQWLNDDWLNAPKAGASPYDVPTAPANPFKISDLYGPISAGLNVASGLFEAAGLRSTAGNYRSQARQYESQAALALQSGFEEAIDIEREGEQVVGEMTAAFGKQGTLLEGSPLLALTDTTRQIERNVLRRVERGRIEQQQYLYAAKQAKKAAKKAESASWASVVKAGASAAPFLLL